MTVHHPIVRDDGDLALALYGSFLPVPDLAVFGDAGDQARPGAVEPAAAPIEINAGRRSITLEVVHRGDRPIQVGSHYAFADTNTALEFDRDAARGMRLDIPAGTAVRFEPGDAREVQLVALASSAAVEGAA